MAVLIKREEYAKIDTNFWNVFPDLRILGVFREFYNADFSPLKIKSSNDMWAIALIYGYESRYSVMPFEDRVLLVEEDFLNKKSYFETNRERLEPYIQYFNLIQIDAPHRVLAEFDKALDDRTRVLDSERYSLANMERIDKARLNTKKLIAEREAIKGILEAQVMDEDIRAGRDKSFLEEEEENPEDIMRKLVK